MLCCAAKPSYIVPVSSFIHCPLLASGEMALTLDNLTEIINTASHLQVSFALEVCSSYIKTLMTFDNAEDFLHIADTYSLDKVTAHWEHMIQDKFFEFSQVSWLGSIGVFHFVSSVLLVC